MPKVSKSQKSHSKNKESDIATRKNALSLEDGPRMDRQWTDDGPMRSWKTKCDPEGEKIKLEKGTGDNATNSIYISDIEIYQ